MLGFGTLIAITLGLGAAYHTIVVIDQAADEVGRRKILGCGDSADSDERVLEQFDTGKSKYAESTEKLPPFVKL